MLARCTACLQEDLEELIDFGIQPLVGHYPASAAESLETPRFPLSFYFCCNCGLVQMPEEQKLAVETLFANYSYASSTVSPVLKQHFDGLAQWICERVVPSRVLEIGCGDGVLLDSLRQAGVNGAGVEVAANIAARAREKGHRIYTRAFGPSLVAIICEDESPFDLVTASNSFPHNPDPRSILLAARDVLQEGGYLLLEVMSAIALVRDLQWDTLYHEHPHVHTAKSLRALLESAEFGLVEVIEMPLHQGSLRILARKGAVSAPLNAVEQREREDFPCYLERCKAFGAMAKHSMHELRGSLPRGSWAYGAGARAVMWINAAELVHSVETVVDMSPLRYNTYIPGTRIPVVSPSVFRSSRPPAVLITAWNYQEQVRRQEPQYPGPWIVPLPVLTRFA